MGTIEVVLGDITDQNVEAIVVAARAGRPGHAIACDRTSGPFVIHTAAPAWFNGRGGEDEELSDCYANSLVVAEELEVGSIAFGPIATDFPTEVAAEIATTAIRSLPIIDTIRLVAPDQETCDALRTNLVKPIVELCPTCGAKARPIAYGRRTGGVWQAASAGLVVMYGCLVRGDGTDPYWECTADNEHRWTNGERDERRTQIAIEEAIAVTLGEDHPVHPA
ncbi:macro domain-containing protein [Lentzea sp. NPDC051213]|uniref:macro domain-containing protein n=1 Tax=Lentzea sp. NPDC051213 TaxID=3364126 RepID=UPI00378BA5E4